MAEINAELHKYIPVREIEKHFPGACRASLSRHSLNHLGIAAKTQRPIQQQPRVLPTVPPVVPSREEEAISQPPAVTPPPAPVIPPTVVPILVAESAKSVLEQLKSVCNYQRTLVQRAERNGNLGVANQGLKNLCATLEAIAKLTGEMEQPATNITFTSGWFDGLVRKYSPGSVTIDLSPAAKEIA